MHTLESSSQICCYIDFEAGIMLPASQALQLPACRAQ